MAWTVLLFPGSAPAWKTSFALKARPAAAVHLQSLDQSPHSSVVSS